MPKARERDRREQGGPRGGAAADAFNWALIRSFVAVLDAGSVMGAARRLRAQQPTLSRHIAELEAQLGVALFERTGRGAVPTAAALAIAEAARLMEAGADGVVQRLAVARQVRSGTVRVSASQVVATYLLPPIVAQLQADEPGIEIEIVATDSVSNLLRREADIAIRMVRPEQGSVVARRLGQIPIIAAAHSDYLERAGVPRQLNDLKRHRVLGLDQNDLILKGVQAFDPGWTRRDFALRTDDLVVYAQLVAAGAGIGFLAKYCAERLPGVRPILPQLKIPPLPCWLAVHREIRGNAIVRRVYDFLATAIVARLAR